MISEESKLLFKELQAKGYHREFAYLICQQLNTTWTANRMRGYLRQVAFLPEEEIVDEMLSILNHRDQIRDKKAAEYYQAKINELYAYGFDDDEEDD